MEVEYEAKFLDVDVEEVRARLSAAGATLERPEFFQRRFVFDLPPGPLRGMHSFARVRDEGGVITMTLKRYTEKNGEHPEETEVVVDDFDAAVELLTNLGCAPTSYQENRRELWHLDGADITIDSWPFHEPFVEIEAASLDEVRAVSEKAGFLWDEALFCGVSKLFKNKYGPEVEIRYMPRLSFDMPDPFAKG